MGHTAGNRPFIIQVRKCRHHHRAAYRRRGQCCHHWEHGSSCDGGKCAQTLLASISQHAGHAHEQLLTVQRCEQ